MAKEWIKGVDGKNLKFKRETLLNYAANRWALNKAHSVDAVSNLIRNCAPATFEEWEKYYFEKAKQKKKNGEKIDKQYVINLGKRLYAELSTTVKSELDSITEAECIDYIYNLVINRTYEGYKSEIEIIYDELQGILSIEIKRAPDEWDRTYNVDYYIEVNGRFIGLQIKPIASGIPLDHYQWSEIFKITHQKFGDKKVIYNKEVIEKIKEEINKLKK